MEICETSGLPISMVLVLYQRNAYNKRKLRECRAQKSNAAVGAETLLSSAGLQTTPFYEGQYRAENGNIQTFELLIPMAPRLHQSNGYIKRKLRVWRVQIFNAVIGEETVLRSAGP